MLLKRCFGFGMVLLCIAGLCCVPPGEREFLLLFCGIAGLLVLLSDDGLLHDIEVAASAFLCAHWSVLFRLPVYYIQRSWMLRREKMNWAIDASIRISRKSWNRMPDEECIELILAVAEQEMEKAKDTPCQIALYNRTYREEYLWVQLDGEKRRIFWNTASIRHHSLQEILEELILAIQCYQFYCHLDKRDQQILNSFTEKEADEQLVYWMYLLYENLQYNRNTDAYDIITRQYARTKSIWYSEK